MVILLFNSNYSCELSEPYVLLVVLKLPYILSASSQLGISLNKAEISTNNYYVHYHYHL